MEYLVYFESGSFGIMGCVNAENEHEARNTLTVKEIIKKFECMTGQSVEIVGIEQRDETIELFKQAELFWFTWVAPRCGTMTMINPELMA